MKIIVLPKIKFDREMEKNGWSDNNLPSDKAFISICCNPIIKKNYLEDHKHKTDEHWFKHNHDNVLNVEFDDIFVPEFETNYGMAYGITDTVAKEIVDFAKKNKDKNEIYIHCMAGRSRSVGVGLALKEYFNCDFSCGARWDRYNDFVYNKIKENL